MPRANPKQAAHSAHATTTSKETGNCPKIILPRPPIHRPAIPPTSPPVRRSLRVVGAIHHCFVHRSVSTICEKPSMHCAGWCVPMLLGACCPMNCHRGTWRSGGCIALRGLCRAHAAPRYTLDSIGAKFITRSKINLNILLFIKVINNLRPNQTKLSLQKN